jgi:hypothetical protein
MGVGNVLSPRGPSGEPERFHMEGAFTHGAPRDKNFSPRTKQAFGKQLFTPEDEGGKD